ncbi:MAG: DUF2249 domain-containing protein [Magnetococcales bacterium]|nr:DUF2249 domain-containing protein [Magnetococcales bacterium]NGZ06056.1 DUF2249 domain-containing protein [Magnetococcales bacterium]
MNRHLDVRELPAPEPMLRILEAVSTLAPGESLLVHHNRIPHLLYPRLTERGLTVETNVPQDGEILLTIHRPPQANTLP